MVSKNKLLKIINCLQSRTVIMLVSYIDVFGTIHNPEKIFVQQIIISLVILMSFVVFYVCPQYPRYQIFIALVYNGLSSLRRSIPSSCRASSRRCRNSQECIGLSNSHNFFLPMSDVCNGHSMLRNRGQSPLVCALFILIKQYSIFKYYYISTELFVKSVIEVQIKHFYFQFSMFI